MKNTISARVADFLKNYPPFNEMAQKDLENLSQEVSILYKTKGSVIFEEEPWCCVKNPREISSTFVTKAISSDCGR